MKSGGAASSDGATANQKSAAWWTRRPCRLAAGIEHWKLTGDAVFGCSSIDLGGGCRRGRSMLIVASGPVHVLVLVQKDRGLLDAFLIDLKRRVLTKDAWQVAARVDGKKS
jgi:hypothetical protein